MESCEASLKRLDIDYIDLYQAHRFDYETPLEETLRAFDDLVRQGKVLYIGVSEWTAQQIRDAIRIADDMGFDRIISNQPQYNMLWRVIEPDVIPASEELGVGQIVWSPIAQGVLTGKYKPGQPVPEGSRATDTNGGADFVNRWLKDDVLNAVVKLEPIAADMKLTMAQLAIAWVLSNSNVTSAIVGATRPEQITENALAAGATLPEDVLSAIDYALGDLVLTDPALTVSPEVRP
jgi:aryl-alcohol dehydrogenase-like predicted oxidoreductase